MRKISSSTFMLKCSQAILLYPSQNKQQKLKEEIERRILKKLVWIEKNAKN